MISFPVCTQRELEVDDSSNINTLDDTVDEGKIISWQMG